MLSRLAWAGLVVVAMALMTVGLWGTVHLEPTGEAIVAARRGESLVLVACLLLAAAAYAARRWLAAPWWVVGAIVATAVVCAAIVRTEAIAVLGLVPGYPLVLAALVGVLTAPAGRGAGTR